MIASPSAAARRRALACCALAIAALTAPAPASANETSLIPAAPPVSPFHTPTKGAMLLSSDDGQRTVKFGALLAAQFDLFIDDPGGAESGFSIGDARVRFVGDLDGGFSWFLQTNFVKSVPLLDLKLGWGPMP